MQTHTHRGMMIAIALTVLTLPLTAQALRNQMLV